MARYSTQYAYADDTASSRPGRTGINGGRPHPRQQGHRTVRSSDRNRSQRDNRSSSHSGYRRQNKKERLHDPRESSLRSGSSHSTRYDHRTTRPRHVMTEREREALRQRQIRKLKIQAKKRRVRNARLLFLAVIVLSVFCLYKLLVGITSYIDQSRQEAKQAMQNIDVVTKNTSIDLSGGTSADGNAEGGSGTYEASSASAATGLAALDISDPTHILSNGRYIDATKPMVALTFDDGPKAEFGNRIMDALEAVNGRATFFMIGNLVSKYPDEVKRMVADGHEVANHSYDHDAKLSKKDPEYIRNEFEHANAAIREISGVTPTLVRLPGGNISDTVRSAVTMPMIHWALDTRDWKTRDTASIVNVVSSGIKDGDIVLMHEIYDSTATAVEQLAPYLTEQGFQLVTVSELIQFRNASVQGGNGKQYQGFPPTEENQAIWKKAAEEATESTAASDTGAAQSETEVSSSEGTPAEAGTPEA